MQQENKPETAFAEAAAEAQSGFSAGQDAAKQQTAEQIATSDAGDQFEMAATDQVDVTPEIDEIAELEHQLNPDAESPDQFG